MPPKKQFVVAIREHHILGFLPAAYFLTSVTGKVFYTMQEIINLDTIEKEPELFSDEQKEIVRIINEFSDVELNRTLSKKKVSVQQFFNFMSNDFLQNRVRPYIEKRIVRCLKVVIKHDIPLYHRVDNYANIYEKDQIKKHTQPTEAVFNFVKHENGTDYYLTVRHDDKEMPLYERPAIILSNNPCWLILDTDLFFFKAIDAKKLTPFFVKKHISIPQQTEEKYFSTFVLKALQNYRVNAVGFKVEALKTNQIAVLKLMNNWHGKTALDLSFHYGKTVFRNADLQKIKVWMEQFEPEVIFQKVFRDQNWEENLRDKLVRLGLKLNSSYQYDLSQKQGETGESYVYRFIDWIREHSVHLAKLGFALDYENSETQYSTLPISLDFNVQKQNDWFDIKAIVTIGKLKIPFIRFKKHIINGIREYKLPDGSIVILPENWFADYSDLLNHAQEISDSIKLDKQHFAVLEAAGDQFSIFLDGYRDLLNKPAIRHDNLPKNLNAQLRPYQNEGYQWMLELNRQNFGGCLADDMGLGKTLQTLTLLQYIKENPENAEHLGQKPKKSTQLSLFDIITPISSHKKTPLMALIVMPTSLILNWEQEILKFTPEMKYLKYTGAEREQFEGKLIDYDIILTSYGIVRNDFEALIKYEFNYIILDESQYIKNPQSKTYKAAIDLRSEHRLVLTGTPIENSLTDLWAQFNFINNGLLGDYEFFRDNFVHAIERKGDRVQEQKLQVLIRPFILRRTKQQVAGDLPDLTEHIRFCDMSELQSEIYEKEKSKIRSFILHQIEENKLRNSTVQILQGLTKLRQLANHPKLVGDYKLVDESGKFDEIILDLESLLAEGHKILLFSTFVKHLEIYENYFIENNLRYSKLTGSMTKEIRQVAINDFQENDGNQLFLISLKAGGVGLNLTEADYVFMLDPWWNPAAENQAISRAHRIGQKKKVFVYRYITRDSIEQKIINLQHNKRALADTFIGEEALNSVISESILEELLA